MVEKQRLCTECEWLDYCSLLSFLELNRQLSESELQRTIDDNPKLGSCSQRREQNLNPSVQDRCDALLTSLRRKKVDYSRVNNEIQVDNEAANFGAWLAGVLESGGSLRLKLINRSGKQYGSPEIRFIESDEKKRTQFIQLLNELCSALKVGTHWKVIDKKVVQIIGLPAVEVSLLALPFVLSRQLILDYFESHSMWANKKDPELESEVIKQYLEHSNPSHLEVTKEQYQTRIKNSHFLAGVFDYSGTCTDRERKDRAGDFRRTLRLRTKNHILLETIGEKFGIKLSKPNVKGSRELRVSGDNCAAILSEMKPYLRVLGKSK
ncbi:MAG: hypothetical protein ABI425_03560 [Patescibacteria group bacterium]